MACHGGTCGGLVYRFTQQGVWLVSSRIGAITTRRAPSGRRGAVITPLIGALIFMSLLFGAVSVYLGEEVHESATLPTDQHVLRAIDSRTAAWPVVVGNDVSLLGTEVVLGVVGVALIGWFALRRRWLDALFLLGALGGYVVLTFLLKHVVNRERPVAFFRIPESGPSYPSGHMLGATCLAFALGSLLWRRTASRGLKAGGSVALFLMVPLVALSRLMLGVHYPTDVLGSIVDVRADRAALRRRTVAHGTHTASAQRGVARRRSWNLLTERDTPCREFPSRKDPCGATPVLATARTVLSSLGWWPRSFARWHDSCAQ